MKLADYLAHHDLSYAEFARSTGTTRQNVERWAKGLRLPRREMMVRIAEQTAGEVTSNDFMDLPEITGGV